MPPRTPFGDAPEAAVADQTDAPNTKPEVEPTAVPEPDVVGADVQTLDAPAEEPAADYHATVAQPGPHVFVGFVDGKEYAIGEDGLDIPAAAVELLAHSAIVNGVTLNFAPLETTEHVDETPED